VKPVGFRYNDQLGTVDISGTNMEASAKFRNIHLHPHVAFVVDDIVGAGPEGVRFLELRGDAEQVTLDAPPQGLSPQIIRIHPRRVVRWNVAPGEPGMHTEDLMPDPDQQEVDRPAMGAGAAATQEAFEAVSALVEELQAGWDQADADVTDRHLAADVLWGSPFGTTVQGYEQLHAAHVRLKQQRMGGTSSRFEIVQVIAPAPDVAVAHVRRTALGPEGHPARPATETSGPFSEMALYVLVRRDGTWWLAAGQNTPVRPKP